MIAVAVVGLYRSLATSLVGLGLLVSMMSAPAIAQTPAKELFGAMDQPAPLAARSIGAYARGCLAGGVALPITGPYWQHMRLSRNRNWGHPELIAYLERLAEDAVERDGWPGLLVGDLSQPRGGPMLTGHRSHQIGLDADIWLTAMPNRELTPQDREEMSAISVLREGQLTVDPDIWTPVHHRLIRRAASYPEVARIFVHPGIKRALCEAETGDRVWLRKVRPWYGHHYHFHVRLSCPEGLQGCTDQAAPPAGDGCGSELAWWFTDEPWAPSDTPARPRRELALGDLPNACRQVLQAAALPNAADIPLPRPRPD
ncbi:MAG: penicillin-insensitive murein endopeptidase [Pseudomonadota bacterium]